MKQEKNGITVAGSMVMDASYQINTYPKQGMLARITSLKYSVGGSCNVAIDLAKFDHDLPVRISGMMGQDSTGEMVVDVLSGYPNIDTRNITRQGIGAVSYVMNAMDTKQRTFFLMTGSNDDYDESYIDWDIVDSRIFHLMYLLSMARIDAPNETYGTNGAKVLHDAQQRGMKTSFDIHSEQISRAHQIVTPALKYTNYCSVNEVEAGDILGTSLFTHGKLDESLVEQALYKLHDLGVSDWVVIHCPEAGYGYDCKKEKFIRVPSLCLPEGFIKGTIGAGDAYCSGVLYGAYMGWDIEKSLCFARAAAASALTEESGTDGVRTKEEIWELEKNMR